MRVWDLRRGDDDDNCTSPHGRGLRSLVFSAALEFNYLKAPIGFIVLIVAPALLIGIAPSVVIDYGRLMLHSSYLAGGSPILGLALFLVLAGAAFWIGRPLAAMAFDNFWHLHYSLVLPILVALRELLRSMAERFGRRSVTPEQLDRGRKIWGVAGLAALALSG